MTVLATAHARSARCEPASLSKESHSGGSNLLHRAFFFERRDERVGRAQREKALAPGHCREMAVPPNPLDIRDSICLFRSTHYVHQSNGE